MKYSPLAFCPELGKSVTPEEVWALWFGEGWTSKLLTFFCADEKCGARLSARNIKPHLMPSEGRFRLYPGAHHKDTCLFSRSSALKKKPRRNRFNFEIHRNVLEENCLFSEEEGWHILSALGLSNSLMWRKEGDFS